MIGLVIDTVAPALIVVALAWPLRVPDEPYFAGLAAAGTAALFSWVALLLLVLSRGALEMPEALPTWLSIGVVVPLFEEGSRVLWGVRARASLVGPREWLFFGVGYALFETVSELMAWGASAFSSQPDHTFLVAATVSLIVLTTWGVLVGALLNAGWPWWLILPITFGLHALHNLFAAPSNMQLVTLVCFYLAAVALLLRFGSRVLRLANKVRS